MAATSWMTQAGCLGRTDLDWFDLDCGLDAAIAVCHTCPVITDCLNYAIKHDLTDGVWGGLWGQQLTKLVRRRIGG
jgi:WhiB family transcriptional regulator, redox-sensing transcriptional regulator